MGDNVDSHGVDMDIGVTILRICWFLSVFILTSEKLTLDTKSY